MVRYLTSLGAGAAPTLPTPATEAAPGAAASSAAVADAAVGGAAALDAVAAAGAAAGAKQQSAGAATGPSGNPERPRSKRQTVEGASQAASSSPARVGQRSHRFGTRTVRSSNDGSSPSSPSG